MGVLSEVVRSRDNVIRRAEVKYSNAGEDIPQFTDRSVMSLVKLFNVNDGHWKDDMDEVAIIAESIGLGISNQQDFIPATDATGVTMQSDVDPITASTVTTQATVREDCTLECGCCCIPHHQFCLHSVRPSKLKIHCDMPDMSMMVLPAH